MSWTHRLIEYLIKHRRYGIGLAVALTVGSVVVTIGTYTFGWRFGLPVDSIGAMAAVNAVAALMSLILVALAGVVAILAYAFASGQPDLSPNVQFPWCEPDVLRFEVGGPDSGIIRDTQSILRVDSHVGTVTIDNTSRYAARNPGVRLTFEGVWNLGSQEGWETIAWQPIGLSVMQPIVERLQWDGGADRLIHGEWSRTLPPVSLKGAQWSVSVERPTLTITVVADGISPRSKTYDIELIEDGPVMTKLREWERNKGEPTTTEEPS